MLLVDRDKAYFVDLFVRSSNMPAIKMYEKVCFLTVHLRNSMLLALIFKWGRFWAIREYLDVTRKHRLFAKWIWTNAFTNIQFSMLHRIFFFFFSVARCLDLYKWFRKNIKRIENYMDCMNVNCAWEDWYNFVILSVIFPSLERHLSSL